jgi:hypothetical protein
MSDPEISVLRGQVASLNRKVSILTVLLGLFVVISAILAVGFARRKTRGTEALRRQSSYQRFVPVTPEATGPAHWFFSLDTKTGQLCMTSAGERFAGPFESLNGVPLCSELYQRFPD